MLTKSISCEVEPQHRRHRVIRFLIQREVLLLIFIALFGTLASILSPHFLDVYNFKQVLISISLDSIVAVGMTIVLIGGGIDLSVGSIIGFAAALLASCFQHQLPILPSILLAVLSSVAIGAINGALVAYVNINPIIATLGMLEMARSASYVLSGGFAFSSFPKLFVAFAAGNVVGIPNLAVVALGCVLVFSVLLANNVALRKYFFIGGNTAAAFRAGVSVERYKMLSYIISAAFAALAAILLTSRMGSSFPSSGSGTEIRVISACIIGGCSVTGGKGTVLGSFLGVLLLGLVSNILVLLGVSVYWQGIASGAILVAAVATDALLNRRKY